MYPKDLTDPIKKEIEEKGIANLETATQVDDFIKKNQEGNAILLINSVCGCAAGIARPGLYKGLEHPLSPTTSEVASVFAGVDSEATNKAREYLEGYPPSSPNLAFFRKGELMHVLERHNIEGLDLDSLNKVIGSIYDKFFSEEIKPEVKIYDPFSFNTIEVDELAALSEQAKIFDCRSQEDFAQSAIPGSKLLDQAMADEMVSSWDKDTKIIFYCSDGSLSPKVVNYFKRYGFTNTFVLNGGYNSYLKSKG